MKKTKERLRLRIFVFHEEVIDYFYDTLYITMLGKFESHITHVRTLGLS